MQLTVHTAGSAPAESQAGLQEAAKAFGFVPNLLGVLAESPVALASYMNFSSLLGKTSFTPVEQQILMIAVSYENDCRYCVAAHSAIAAMVRMPSPVLSALRSGEPLPDARQEILRSFTADLVRSRGRVSEHRMEAFLAAGYTRRHLLEVVFAVAMKTLSNYVNHIGETPLDPQFAAQDWPGREAAAPVIA